VNPGTRATHNQFCLTEKWEAVRNARGGKVTHHITYELPLMDGRRLRTRVSRPADNTTYGPSLWKTILRDQLEVTEEEFWACVKAKQLPDRGQEAQPASGSSLPAGLVYQLLHVARVPEAEVKGMTLEQANERMAEHWSRPSQ
jgi:hypothetical protein